MNRLGMLIFTLSALTGAGCDYGYTTDLDPFEPEFAPRIGQIVDGTPTTYASFQGVVAVYGAISGTLCTGTLLSPRIVLTAGHCLYFPANQVDYRNAPEEVLIFGGADLRTAEGTVFYGSATDVRLHPSWNDSPSLLSSTDLGILLLDEPILGIDSFRLREPPHTTEGEAGMLVGYGLLSSDDPDSAGVHRQGESVTLQAFAEVLEVGMPTSTCQGDSGGPYFTWQHGQWVVTGVTSFGTHENCRAENDGWEVNVLTYRSWVEDVYFDLTGDELPFASAEPKTNEEWTVDGDTDTDTDSLDTETDTDTDTDEKPDLLQDPSDTDSAAGDNPGVDDAPNLDDPSQDIAVRQQEHADVADNGSNCSAVPTHRGRSVLATLLLEWAKLSD